MIQKLSLLLSGAVLLLATLGGCDKADPQKLPGETFTVGYETYAPYFYENAVGAPTGFDFELASEVASRNKWVLKLRPINWTDHQHLLKSGAIDCIWSGFELTPKRMLDFECTNAYSSSEQLIAVTRQSGIKTIADVKGKIIAVQENTPIAEELLSGSLRNLSKSMKQLRLISGSENLIAELEAGRVDGAVLDSRTARRHWKQHPGILLLRPPLTGTLIAAAIRKGSRALRDQIQITLNEMTLDGTMDRLKTKWFNEKEDAEQKSSSQYQHKSNWSKRVLLVHSDNIHFVRARKIVDGFSDYLREHGFAVKYDIQEFDIISSENNQPPPAKIQKLRRKIAENDYDLIAVCNNPATDLFLKGQVKLPKGVPLLILAYHGNLSGQIPPGFPATGTVTPSTELDNAELALDLLQDPDKLVLVTDTSSGGLVQEAFLRDNLPRKISEKLEFLSGRKLSSSDLLERVSMLGANSAVILSSWSSAQEKSGDDAYSILPRLRAATNALILGKYDDYRTAGADGGVLISNYGQGWHAGRLAARVFAGEPAREIPVLVISSYMELDYAALQKHSISKQQLPENLHLTNPPPSFFTRHWEGLAVVAILLVLFTLIVFLGYQNRRKDLLRLTAVLGNLDDPIVVFGADWRVLYRHLPDRFGGGPFTPQRCREHSAQLEKLFNDGIAFESTDFADGRVWHSSWKLLQSYNPFHTRAAICESRDITELHGLVENEKAINGCLETFFSENDLQKSAMQMLKNIRNYLGASHCFLHKVDQTVGCVESIAECSGEGLEPLFSTDSLRMHPNDTILQQIIRHGEVRLNDLTRMDQLQQMDSGSGLCLARDLRSAYIIGIFLKKEFWGVLGVIYEKRSEPELSALKLKFLRYAAHLISLLILRTRALGDLREALEQAREAERSKSNFVASVSHELRTPLNAIIGFSELLQSKKCSPEESSDYLQSIVFSGNALLQIINDVLDLSKLEAGRMQLVQEQTDFRLLGKHSLKVFTQRAAEKHLMLQAELPPIPVFLADKLRLRQILFNLLSNAIKFTDKGSVTLSANFTLEEDSPGEFGTLEFSVQDTGIGIAPENLRKLATPYTQLSGRRSENAVITGTGLGLAISKRLIEKMGGSLRVDSTLGSGSCFSVILPHLVLATSQGTASGRENPTPEEPAENPEFQNRVLLLVDDVAMNLKVLTALSRRLGISSVFSADSGKAALELLPRIHPDLVLTDLWMPKMNGNELAREIHSRHGFEELSVLAVTADLEVGDDREHAIQSEEFRKILLKPITLEKLRQALLENLPQRPAPRARENA